MLNLLKMILAAPEGSPGETPPPEVVVCAVLLEAAEADHEVSPDERALIFGHLQRSFGLDTPQAEAVMAETHRWRTNAADAWPFTTAIRRQFDQDQKKELLVMIWRILLSDKRLSAEEELWARRLRDMLAVNHSLLMDAKRQAREEIERDA